MQHLLVSPPRYRTPRGSWLPDHVFTFRGLISPRRHTDVKPVDGPLAAPRRPHSTWTTLPCSAARRGDTWRICLILESRVPVATCPAVPVRAARAHEQREAPERVARSPSRPALWHVFLPWRRGDVLMGVAVRDGSEGTRATAWREPR